MSIDPTLVGYIAIPSVVSLFAWVSMKWHERSTRAFDRALASGASFGPDGRPLPAPATVARTDAKPGR
jgi:hypothetical protein